MRATYNSAAWSLNAGVTQVGEAFNPEVGFLRRTGFRNIQLGIFHRYRPHHLLGLLEIRPHTSYRAFWNFDGFQETGFWHIDSHWEWKNGYEVHTGINFTREGVRDEDEEDEIDGFEIFPHIVVPRGTYDHAEAAFRFFTNRGAWWSFRLDVTVGGFLGGHRLNVQPSFRFRIGETFNTEFSVEHNNIDLPAGSFVTNLFRARLSYSFTPRLFLQGLLQYNDRDDLWSTNLRFGWLQAANTGLFVAYRETQEKINGGFGSRFRSFVVKYSRLFDLLE